MPDFPYGTDYPEAEWLDRDGQVLTDDPYVDVPPPDEPPDDSDAGDEAAILHRLQWLRVNYEARRRLDDENRSPAEAPPAKSLSRLLEEPDTPVRYRVESVAPADSRIMLSAQYKAGKTTLVGNLVRSLVDGDPFLGTFTVHRTAASAILIDDEMSQDTLRPWLRAQRITNTAAVSDVISLRGKVGSFNLLDDRTRDRWATRFGDLGCDYLVLDCLRPVLDALGLDESRDAGRFLIAFDAMLTDAHIADASVVHHMGHGNERARGDSRLQDWPDAIWRLVRETEEPDSARYFSAYGRDVNVPEGRLSFDPATRRLTYSAGSRGDAKSEAAKLAVISVLAESGTDEGMSGSAIERALADSHSQKNIRAGIKLAVKDRIVTASPGPHNAKMHRIAHPCSECRMPVASGAPRHESCPQDAGGLFE